MKRTNDHLQVLKLNIYYCNIIEHCDKDKYFNPKKYVYNFKSAHVVSSMLKAVTCIKRSPFSYPVIDNFISIELLLRGHLSYKATFSLSQR